MRSCGGKSSDTSIDGDTSVPAGRLSATVADSPRFPFEPIQVTTGSAMYVDDGCRMVTDTVRSFAIAGRRTVVVSSSTSFWTRTVKAKPSLPSRGTFFIGTPVGGSALSASSASFLASAGVRGGSSFLGGGSGLNSTCATLPQQPRCAG